MKTNEQHITVDKRLRCQAPSPKFPSAASFIGKPLYEMPEPAVKNKGVRKRW